MSSPTLSFFIAVVFTTPLLLHAEESAGGRSHVVKYQLKNRSSFNLPETSRPPFWPIGWVKRSATAPVHLPSGPTFVLDEKNFAVTSILTGNPSLAVINGRSYTEGETIRLPKGSGGVKIRVVRIYDGFVQLQLDDQLVSPKLRRQELDPKKPAEDLLLNDER